MKERVFILASCENCAAATPLGLRQQTDDVCHTVVHENVCVQGTVTITPSVVSGESRSFCLGNPRIGECPGVIRPNCSFSVSQRICVQIPLTFSATAVAVPNGIVCSDADIGECTGVTACVRTIGFYRNNQAITNALITSAGGTLLLGDGGGLTITVDTTNATEILSLNPPKPPAPDSPPFEGQYAILYAQLLAAKLNVLALMEQDVDICAFAVSAILAADAFIGSSPVGGTNGAPDFQEPLARFNEGDAPGCPSHCD